MPKGVFLYGFLRKTEKVRRDNLQACGALRRTIGRASAVALRGRTCAREFRSKKNSCNVLNFIPKEEREKKYNRESEEISSELAAELRHTDENAHADNVCDFERSYGGSLKFTNKEISKMRRAFKNTFCAEGQTICYRKRKRGRISCSYEARYRRHGYNISVSATTLDELKEKFIEAINAAVSGNEYPKVPTTFHEFAMYYFETFRIRKVSKATYKNDLYRYNRHIEPYLKSIPLSRVSPLQCQNIIDRLTEADHGKSADEIFSLLNAIFKMAIAHGIIVRNPMSVIIHDRHENEHGKSLTKDEERKLLRETAGTPYQLMFAVALYTGLRPNEYTTARIEGQFIVAVNSKRKNKKVEYKKIPITSMLRKYIDGVTEFKFYVLNRIREKFRSIFPDNKLYDLRTTFYTRCTECGVADAARDEFVGHSNGKLSDTYTKLSDEYLLKEGKKLEAWYSAP